MVISTKNQNIIMLCVLPLFISLYSCSKGSLCLLLFQLLMFLLHLILTHHNPLHSNTAECHTRRICKDTSIAFFPSEDHQTFYKWASQQPCEDKCSLDWTKRSVCCFRPKQQGKIAQFPAWLKNHACCQEQTFLTLKIVTLLLFLCYIRLNHLP